MLNNVLEVAIGMALVFLLFSLVVSGVHEAVARLLAWRSKALWAAIRQMVDGDGVAPGTGGQKVLASLANAVPTARDPRPTLARAAAFKSMEAAGAPVGDLTTAIYAHPLVGELDKLHTRSKSKIEKLPRDEFAAALIDVLVPNGNGETSVTGVKASLGNLPDDSPLKRPLLYFVSEAGESLEGFRTKVEGWFDGQMERLGRRYRRRAKWVMLGIGLAVAFACNVDALNVAGHLYREDALRAAVVAQAEAVAGNCEGKTDEDLTECITSQASAIEDADDAAPLPVGWANAGGRHPLLRALGFILTAFALMQGGPFWFDLVSKGVGWRKGRSADAAAKTT